MSWIHNEQLWEIPLRAKFSEQGSATPVTENFDAGSWASTTRTGREAVFWIHPRFRPDLERDERRRQRQFSAFRISRREACRRRFSRNRPTLHRRNRSTPCRRSRPTPRRRYRVPSRAETISETTSPPSATTGRTVHLDSTVRVRPEPMLLCGSTCHTGFRHPEPDVSGYRSHGVSTLRPSECTPGTPSGISGSSTVRCVVATGDAGRPVAAQSG